MKNIFFPMALGLTVFLMILLVRSEAKAEWAIDLSRRTQQMQKAELTKTPYSRNPAAVKSFEGEEPVIKPDPTNDTSFLEKVFDAGEPVQDVVILNTERGFVPNTIRIRKDGRYTVHIVNVNEKEKNVSFILDGFSEHHATFFGKVKSFKLEPRKEGVYSFLSPETAVEGKFIVFAAGPDAAPKMRAPATAQMGGE